MSILISTYEGTHNHPLPMPSMLQSPSSFTNTPLIPPSSLQQPKTKFPSFFNNNNDNNNNNSLISSITSRSPPPYNQHLNPNSPIIPSSSSHHQFRTFTSKPRYASYSSHSPSQSLISLYSNGTRERIGGKKPLTMQQETIEAATKAVTTNPKFQSAIAAALTSYVNKNGGSSGFYSTGNGLDCTVSSSSSSRYMMNNNVSSSSSSGINNGQQGKMVLFPPIPAASEIGSGSGSVYSDRSNNQILEQWRKRKNLTINAPKESNL